MPVVRAHGSIVQLFAKGDQKGRSPHRVGDGVVAELVTWRGEMDGSGWVSNSMPYVVPRAEGQGDAWQEEAAARGGVGAQRIVQAGEVAAPAEVAAFLAIAPGARVIARQRIICLDDRPTELTDTYYPVEVARGTRLEKTTKIRGGAVTLLAELGYTAHRVREEVSARMPSEPEQQALGLTDREPVLCMTRVAWDIVGRPFQVDVSVFPSSEQRLRYELAPRR